MKITCPYCNQEVEMDWRCPHCHNRITYDINNELERINPHRGYQKLQFRREDYAICCKNHLDKNNVSTKEIQKVDDHYLVYYMPIGKEQSEWCHELVIQLLDFCLF